jgi:hypothetical protein
VRVEREILGRVSLALFVREVRPEGGKDAGLLLVGQIFAGLAAPRDLCGVIACDAAETLNHPRHAAVVAVAGGQGM